jgi:hypothetical protein
MCRRQEMQKKMQKSKKIQKGFSLQDQMQKKM